MAWLRFGTTRGLNIDELTEWTYEERVPPSPFRYELAPPYTGHMSASDEGIPETPVTTTDPSPVSARAARQSAARTAEHPDITPAPVMAEVTPGAVAEGEVVPVATTEPVVAEEPVVGIPTLHLYLRDGRTVDLEGEDATKALAFLVATTSSL